MTFREANTHVLCDISVSRPGTSFKAKFLKLVADIDPRFPVLLRLVKSWAKAHDLNDAGRSTFNSWSLALLVIFHLQVASCSICRACRNACCVQQSCHLQSGCGQPTRTRYSA